MTKVVLCDPLTLRRFSLEKNLLSANGLQLLYCCKNYTEMYGVIPFLDFDVLLVLFDDNFFNNFPLDLDLETDRFKIIYVIPNEYNGAIELNFPLSNNSHFAKINCVFEDLEKQIIELGSNSKKKLDEGERF